MMTYDEICEFLPHRPPFLLVDKVIQIDIGHKIIACKSISSNEPIFQGHFPGNPIFPGVYILEGMAQAAAILTFKTRIQMGLPDERFAVLTGVEEARFRRQIIPGDVIRYEIVLDKCRGNFAWMSGKVFVDDSLAAEAKLSAAVGGKK